MMNRRGNTILWTCFTLLLICPLGIEACSLCFDGSPPTLLEATAYLDHETGHETTCAQLASFMQLDTYDQSFCARHQLQGGLRCGCPMPPVEEQGECPLCFDGSAPPLMDSIAVFGDEGNHVTCSNLALYSLTQDFETSCPYFQALGRVNCGCPINPAMEASTCFLCSTTDLPPNLDDIVVVGNNPSNDEPNTHTCRDFAVFASQLQADSEDCLDIQAVGVHYCGCDMPTDPECTLCVDASTVAGVETSANQIFQLPEEVQEEEIVSEGSSCGFLEVLAALHPSGDSCRALQVTAGFYCGCPYDLALEESVCRLCGNRMALLNPNKMVRYFGELASCAIVEHDANLMGTDCQAFQNMFGDFCCDDTTPTDSPQVGPVEGGDPSQANTESGADRTFKFSLWILWLIAVFHGEA